MSFLSSIPGRWGKNNNKNPAPPKSPNGSPSSQHAGLPSQQRPSGSPGPSISGNQGSGSMAPSLQPVTTSPSLSQTIAMDPNSMAPSSMVSIPDDIAAYYNLPRPIPMWLDNSLSKQIVKGNFSTLSSRPKTVEPAEWIASQVVDHFRLLWYFVKVMHDKEENGYSICNPQSCPRMSAGHGHSFTWLNVRKEPTEVPANEYITLMYRWISGKIDNTNIFPTDQNTVSYMNDSGNPEFSGGGFPSGTPSTPGGMSPIPAGPTNLSASLSELSGPDTWIGKSSNFPRDFIDVCQTIFRQMFRVYAHLYWHHFLDFYHLNLDKALNSHFTHFLLTSADLDLLKPTEVEPMQPLVDLWAANKTIPQDSAAYKYANVKAGLKLMVLSANKGEQNKA